MDKSKVFTNILLLKKDQAHNLPQPCNHLLLDYLPTLAHTIETPIDALTFAQLVLSTLEHTMTSDAPTEIYSHGNLRNAQIIIQRKITSLELEDVSDG